LPAHYAELNALFEELSDDDLATLVSLLRRLRGAIPPSLADP
jgi:hypothetical protein